MNEIEHDLLFQKFYQEVIKNFNTIDQKLLADSQKHQRDVLNLKAGLDELRRYTKDHHSMNNNLLEKGDIETSIEKVKNRMEVKLLENETKQMRNLTDLNEDINAKIHALQDQISNLFFFMF